MKPQADTEIVNCLSIDVEGFVESNRQSFTIDEKYLDPAKEQYEIETNLAAVLELLEEAGTQATFFFLGTVARAQPHLVTQVAGAGHEIGSHSYQHLRIFDLDRREFTENLRASKEQLEDLSGRRVCGFRAPEFSITTSSVWALDVLMELGFVWDSSVYPIGLHDVYGLAGAEPFIHELSNGLIEFPLSTIGLWGRRIPFGGGGYFRLYPLPLTRRFITRTNRLGQACMFYIHPYELGPIIPRIAELSFYRRFRHYYNCRNGSSRLRNVLRRFKFASGMEVLTRRGLVKDS